MLLILPALSHAATPCTTKTLTIQGKNFTFDFNSAGGSALCGQFANLDWWVAPAVGQSTVTVTGVTTTSDNFISADVDPIMESMGLRTESQNYGNYSAAQDIIPALPQSYSGINSIVAALEKNQAVDGQCGTSSILGGCLYVYAVLTILPSVPSNEGIDMLRPNITGETKEVITWSDLDLTRLPAKSYFPAKTEADLEVIRERWAHNTEIFSLDSIDGMFSEGGRAFRSELVSDDYGADNGGYLNNGFVAVMSSGNTIEQKKPALASLLSYGLDIYHAMYDAPVGRERYWAAGASQAVGKVTAPYFLGALLTDETIMDKLKLEPTRLHEFDYLRGPLELGQIQKGTDAAPVWGTYETNNDLYWAGVVLAQKYDGGTGAGGNTNQKQNWDPYGYIDGPTVYGPASGYFSSSRGPMKALAAFMHIMPEMCEVVNYPRLTTFIDRVENSGIHAYPDPCTTPDSRDVATNCLPGQSGTCTYYGITWGDDGSGNCITTPAAGYNKVGRYVDGFHGQPDAIDRQQADIEAAWTTIRSESVCGSGTPARIRYVWPGGAHVTGATDSE